MSRLSDIEKIREKGRIFVDMDGVLAEWNAEASLEQIHEKGYFLNRPPMETVVDAVKEMIRRGEEVWILSAVLQNEHAMEEKKEWLSRYLPEIKPDRQVFVPYGEKKADYIPDKRATDVLIDDYTENLKDWHAVGVKLLNGLNWSNGSWKGMVVDFRSCADAIAQTVIGIRTICDMGLGKTIVRERNIDIGGLEI